MLAEFAITSTIHYTNTASLVMSPTTALAPSLIADLNCEVTALFNAMHKT